ncbi:hypothetical protein BELL_0546g00050 [Botrytis elliptica]|uniref:Zn(2)-C6 fungal-type domain-containing protein n=1 Tax=Botrytis elliptica TaxID=278938 RepID=A0A4Z1JD80_9HELO|nr:hypothetical protein BELL_0546g00050 [Botrytis elliptica]
MPVDQPEGSFVNTFRRRSRRGCLTCRQHRLKCDENGPKCGNCSRLGKHCRWGLKASFHSSRMTKLSPSDSANLSEIESVRKPPNNFQFVDETKEIEGEYDRHDETLVLHKSSQGNADDIILLDAHSHCKENASDRFTIRPGTQTPQLSSFTMNGDSQNNPEMTIGTSQSLGNLEDIQHSSSQSPPTNNFLTYDIWIAYASGRSTLIPLDKWRVAHDEALHGLNQDTYSNRAIFITARIVNELSRDPVALSETNLRNLWAELQTWVVERPQNVRCIIEVEASGDSPFPIILFSNTAAGMESFIIAYNFIGSLIIIQKYA